MKQLIHLLKYKLLLFLRFDRKLNFSEIIKNFGSSLVYIGFSIGTFLFTKFLIWFLLTKIRIGLFLLHEFISMLMFIFFVSVNVGNIIVSYSTLYKSNELSFLITRPIEPLKIFLIKFLDNFFYSSSTLILILISVLLGYSIYFKMSISSMLIFFLFNFIPYIFSAGCLGVIILLLILKLATKYSLRKIILSAIILYLILVYSFFEIQSPVKLVNSIMKYYPFENRDSFFEEIIPPLLKYLPNHWLSESAYWIVKNNFYKSISLFIYQIIFSIVLFSIAIILGKHLYYDTLFSSIKFKKEKSILYKLQNNVFTFTKKSILQPVTESILKKEIILFIREPSQIIHFGVIFFLIITFAISISRIQYTGFGNYLLQTIIYLSIMIFNFLLISTLSLRFVFPLISLEGLSFWKIKSAPVNMNKLALNKLFPAGIIILLTALFLNLLCNFRFGIEILLISSLITLFTSIIILLINYGMGGIFVNFKEKNPIRLASSRGASLSFLINVIVLLMIILLILNYFVEYFLSLNLSKNFNYTHIIYSLIIITFLSIAIAFIFYRNSLKALEKDFI